jgi:hypothetical protein
MSDSRRGFGLDIKFIDHSYTRLGTTSNCSVIAKLHNLQITTAHAKSFASCRVFTSCSLVTASNRLKSCLNGGCLPADSFLHALP